MEQLNDAMAAHSDDVVRSTETAEVKEELDQLISDYQKKNSASFIELKFHLGHKLMQNVCENQFDFLARNSFLCNRFCDYLASMEITEASEAHMSNLFKKVEDMLNLKLQQFGHIATTEGIVIDVQNARRREYVKLVSSPLARRYMKLLEKADQALTLCDALWLYDLMSQAEKQKLAGDIRNKMAGMARTIEYHKNNLLAQLNKRKKNTGTKDTQAKDSAEPSGDTGGLEVVSKSDEAKPAGEQGEDKPKKPSKKAAQKTEEQEIVGAGIDKAETEERLKIVNEG